MIVGVGSTTRTMYAWSVTIAELAGAAPMPLHMVSLPIVETNKPVRMPTSAGE
jgi:hypothetical protein